LFIAIFSQLVGEGSGVSVSSRVGVGGICVSVDVGSGVSGTAVLVFVGTLVGVSMNVDVGRKKMVTVAVRVGVEVPLGVSVAAVISLVTVGESRILSVTCGAVVFVGVVVGSWLVTQYTPPRPRQ
jgi:hypothetical protein